MQKEFNKSKKKAAEPTLTEILSNCPQSKADDGRAALIVIVANEKARKIFNAPKKDK